MNIKQLEAFTAIARFGSFAVAADRLNLTQSTISVRIKELEQDLGVELVRPVPAPGPADAQGAGVAGLRGPGRCAAA